jgi:hypothetical protein
MLNETMSLNRSNMTNVEPSRTEQPSYFNARESIIPKLPETPLKQELQPPPAVKGPPPPPPPPPPPKTGDKKKIEIPMLQGRDAMIEELKYAQTDEGKAEKARKKAEKEARKVEKEARPQQSTTDFLNMSFTPPKKDIVQMMTPNKDDTSTAIIPYRENKSFLDFVMGGSPAKTKTAQDLKEEKMKARLTELNKKKKLNAQESFELNDLKSHFTAQPNLNKEIASGIIKRIAKSKVAQEELVNKKIQASIEEQKQQKQREDAFERIKAASKRKLTKQYVDAKKELKSKDTGQPLVVSQNAKQLILKKNRDRGIKAQQVAATKKRDNELEKIINFSKFMLEKNGVKPYSGLKQTNI